MTAVSNEEGNFDGYSVKVFAQQWDLDKWLRNDARNEGVKRIVELTEPKDLEALFKGWRIPSVEEGDTYLFYLETEKVKPIETAWETD